MVNPPMMCLHRNIAHVPSSLWHYGKSRELRSAATMLGQHGDGERRLDGNSARAPQAGAPFNRERAQPSESRRCAPSAGRAKTVFDKGHLQRRIHSAS